MLSSHCFWRCSIHGNLRLRATCTRASSNRNAIRLGPAVESNAYGIQPLTLSSNAKSRRWFTQTTSAQADKPSTDVGDNISGTSTTREPSSPRTALKQSPLDASSPHNSLQSFQAHARRTGLSTTSTVYTGTSYEYLTQSTLKSYDFDLHRVGGRGDRGVDLIGIWRIPILSLSGAWKEKSKASGQRVAESSNKLHGFETQPLKVLVQCKRLVGLSAKVGPHLIRELDGAVRGARSAALFDVLLSQNAERGTAGGELGAGTVEHGNMGPQTPLAGPALGVLVSTKPATKGVVDSMRRSSRGLVWIMMEEVDDGISEDGMNAHGDKGQNGSAPLEATDQNGGGNSVVAPAPAAAKLRGKIRQMLWNQAARDLGLEGVDVVKRYDANGREEVVLMRGDRVWGGS